MPGVVRLFRHYVLKRIDGAVSPAVFWGLPEIPVVIDAPSAAQWYAARPVPPYPIDYTGKLSYPLHNDAGIPLLNYGAPIGRQVNPEAAFQIALGWHTRSLAPDPRAHDRFLALTAALLPLRDDNGRWLYQFDWFGSRRPWYSVLSQARGASVMLRAWFATGDERYREAATQAVSLFGIPVADGGFRAIHPRVPVPYLEEYPFQPTAAINGFLAALIGLLEVAVWLDDPSARALADEYLAAAEALLPVYTTHWWTLYDFDPDSPMANVHSPRYHRMVTGYVAVLAALTGRPAFAAFRDRWSSFDRPAARLGAACLKTVKKLRHR